MTSISKLRTLSQLMAISCVLLMLGISLSSIWFWSDFKQNAMTLEIAQRGVLQIETIQTWQIVLAATFSLITALVLIYGLEHLRRLFINFKEGNFFTESSVRSMHHFCAVLFISAILKVLSTMFLSVILTWNNGPNQKALIVQFGSNELWSLFIAITFLAIAWSFKEGLRLSNENAEFV